MCLVLFAYQTHPQYRLVLAANRDEFYGRPTQPLGFWNNSPEILAGRDLQAGGTWLGMTSGGRIAAITNYREPQAPVSRGPSRGHLVRRFLEQEISPLAYAHQLQREKVPYAGYNLLIGDRNELAYVSNRGRNGGAVRPGIYGLSNRLLNTPWPKVAVGKRRLTRLVNHHDAIDRDALFRLLADQSMPEDHDLPDTGVGLAWERILAPVFITSDTYGTRSASVILWDYGDRVYFGERVFDPAAPRPDIYQAYAYTLKIAG
jgi:uncharacterized protein with NRDE domain